MRLDGHRLVIDALTKGLQPLHVLLTDRAIDAPLGPDLLWQLTNGLSLRSSGVPGMPAVPDTVENAHHQRITMVSEKLLLAVQEDVTSSQGVLAIFERPKVTVTDAPFADAKKQKQPQEQLTVILDAVTDPGNLGMIVRAACGLGATAIVSTPGSCDAWSPKALRASAGASLALPMQEEAWDSAGMAALLGTEAGAHAQAQAQVLLADSAAAAGAVAYDQIDYTRPTVLIIGGEAFGPSAAARAIARRTTVGIPLAGGQESLNAASAASIILAEAARQRRAAAR